MTAPGRSPFGRYRDLLRARGFRPSRRLGQNFLLDPSLHRALADAAAVEAGDLVLEIGAGLGFLTRELARRRARVVAVEVDPRLHGILAEELPAFPDAGRGVRLCLGDALDSSHRGKPGKWWIRWWRSRTPSMRANFAHAWSVDKERNETLGRTGSVSRGSAESCPVIPGGMKQ